MNTKRERRRRRGAGRAALAFFVCFLLLVLLWGAAVQETLPGVLLGELPAGGARLLLLEEQNGRVWAVWSGEEQTTLVKLDASGRELARRETDSRASWAALRGGSLFLREEPNGDTCLICCRADSLEETSRRELGQISERVVFFDCDSAGTVYCLFSENRKRLCALSLDGEEELQFRERIVFAGVDSEDGLWVCAGNSLFFRGDAGNTLRELPGAGKPLALLGRRSWIDEDGVVSRLSDRGAEPLFRTEETVYVSRFYCLDREDRLFLSGDGGSVKRYGLSGGQPAVCQPGKGVKGLCPLGAVCEREGSLWYVPLDFSAPAVTPAPTSAPTPTPKPAPEPPPEEAPARVEEGLLVAEPGMTAARIRELLEPDTAEIRDALGRRITEGRLATGMTVNRWTVVIPGDCDGNGVVNGKDVRAAMKLLLGRTEAAEAFRRAADLDEDGRVTAADLVLLSRLAGSWE